MRKEDLKKIIHEGPLCFEDLRFHNKTKVNSASNSDLIYKKSVEGYVRLKPFYKYSIRL